MKHSGKNTEKKLKHSGIKLMII